MHSFQHFVLKNGLKVFVIEDKNTPLAVVNILYDVGSRDEHPDQTGFAHLFEHLMFGGSKNVPSYDAALQKIGGDNNAFTNNDITNYYLTLPCHNIESAFWLESDRMMALSLTDKAIQVQKKVVIEEFKQRYLNQPYGDVWFHLREMAYKVHPYQWPTIGKKIEHIENATREMVVDFHRRFYGPGNATMVVAGNVEVGAVELLAKKWFEDIPGVPKPNRQLPQEPDQMEARSVTIEKQVPANAIYKVFHGPGRLSPDYYDMDILSDILTRGESSLLYTRLVKKERMMSSIKSSMMSSADPGLFYLNGRLNKGVVFEEVEEVFKEELDKVASDELDENVVVRAKNKAESSLRFSKVDLLNKAMSLAIFANLGQPELIDLDIENLRRVNAKSVRGRAAGYLKDSNCSTLYYNKKKK